MCKIKLCAIDYFMKIPESHYLGNKAILDIVNLRGLEA